MSPITAIKLLVPFGRDRKRINFVTGDHSGNVFWMNVRSLYYLLYTFDRQRLIPK